MDSTRVMRGAKAPGAASPGTGSGNVPFAPGLINGRNLGQQTTQAPLARQAGGQGSVNINVQSSPPEKPQGAAPPPAPMGGGMGGPIISAENMMNIYNAYMEALMDSVKSGKPLIGGIY